METLPTLGKSYYFFDDGKTGISRCYKATVTSILPADTEVVVEAFDYDLRTLIPRRLQDIRRDTVNDHRASENFIVGRTKPGEPWLYSEETDYYIEAIIPGYDEYPIWFVRTIRGGWFSMNIQDSWQSGRLDVSGEFHQRVKEMTDTEYWDGWYDQQLKDKGIYIDE